MTDLPPYAWCLECGRTYATKRDLRREHRWSIYRETSGVLQFFAALMTPASRIHSCPDCLHDFLPRSAR